MDEEIGRAADSLTQNGLLPENNDSLNDFYFAGSGGRCGADDRSFPHSWQALDVDGSFPEARRGHTSNVIGNNVYVFGGFNGKTWLNDLHVAKVKANKVVWNQETTPDAPVARSFVRDMKQGNSICLVI